MAKNSSIRCISGIDILFRYERTAPYMLSDLILTNIFVIKFVNLMMRDGRKYAAVKVFYRMLHFVHMSFHIDPLFIIYYIFTRHRMKYDVFVRKLGSSRTIVFPRTLHGPSQIFKCMHFFFDEVRKQSYSVSSYYEKVGIALIRCFIDPMILNSRIKEIYNMVFDHKMRLPLVPKKFRISRKSTIHYWSLSKSYYGADYRRNRTTLKPV